LQVLLLVPLLQVLLELLLQVLVPLLLELLEPQLQVLQLEPQLELQFFLRSQQKRLSLRQREEGKTFSLL